MNELEEAGASGRRAALRWCEESGKSSIRGLFAVFLIVGMVYLSWKFLPVKTASYQFEDAIRDEVMYIGRGRTTDKQIKQNLLETAEVLGLPITPEKITISRPGRKYIIIEANYTVTIELIGGYQFDWTFSPHQEGPIF